MLEDPSIPQRDGDTEIRTPLSSAATAPLFSLSDEDIAALTADVDPSLLALLSLC
jgi:hypothetical protein